METDYLIIGGGLAGGYAAEAIRSIDRSGELTLVTDENHRPYDRVPLSKTYLKGVLKRDRLYIRRLEHYQQNNIQLLLGRHVKRIDLHHKRVFLDDGDEISYGRLLLATGGRPRRLSIEGSDLEGIFYLRTLDDSERIRIAMAYAGKVVVIGGGFIGCEVASVMREKGLEVTMVEVFPQLLGRVLDKESAGWITSYFREMGVAVKTGVSAVKILGEGGRVKAVMTSDGTTLDADIVVVGIGIAPNTELAEDAGLKTGDGILVNEYLETSSSDVYAAGDVARFYSPIYGKSIRVEHYDVAVGHGDVAGSNMAGRRIPYVQPPYFFSNIFNLSIQVYGITDSYDNVITLDDGGDEGGFIKFYLHNRMVDGVLLLNKTADINAIRDLISTRTQVNDPGQLKRMLG